MESELISLISQIVYNRRSRALNPRSSLISFISLITQLITLVSSLDLESQPKPEVISLISQIISLAGSISVSEPDWELVSVATQMISLISSAEPDMDPDPEPKPELVSLVNQIFFHFNNLNYSSELGPLLARLFSFFDFIDWDSEPESEGVPEQLISLFPQLDVRLERGRFCVTENLLWKGEENGNCNLKNNRKFLRLTRGAEITHFFCGHCRGEKHEDCDNAPLKVKHPLHPRHSLQLVLWRLSRNQNRKCYCCDEDLIRIFYYCPPCDCAINIACVEKAAVLSVDHPRWHHHKLALFPRQTSLPCNLCSLTHAGCTFYICPPCQFVVHQRCISLPNVIKISRHLHRISFTPSFDQGYWYCGVCRKPIYNDYGGYSCIHSGCFYAAHSKCATQSNLWDGKELEGTPEEIDEQGVEPFLRIGNGIIQHFSHQQHHLRLDENVDRDYDENKLCQACITPIYSGNFYSCMECDFILHEECANFSRKIQHPIHPHLLTLVTVAGDRINIQTTCSACPWLCTSGFFYECGKEGCNFKLHVQCATISEPLVHGSHMHPLFLTSKPGERRTCSVCKDSRNACSETFNCIECDFSLCFMCATIPQKVRYKHDKHMFTLSYGKETSTMTYWCEACERKINPKAYYKHDKHLLTLCFGEEKTTDDLQYWCEICEEKLDATKWFYTCNSCSVTLHATCLFGKIRDMYMKPNHTIISDAQNVEVARNSGNSRPV